MGLMQVGPRSTILAQGQGMYSDEAYNATPASGMFNAWTLNTSPTFTANTWTSWYEIVSSTPRDSCALALFVSGTWAFGSGSLKRGVYEIGFGAASSETTVIGPVNATGMGPLGSTAFLVLPIWVPKGTRVSIRFKSENAATPTTTVKMYQIAALGSHERDYLPTAWVSYGLSGTPTTGVSLDCSTSATGTWTEIGTASAYHRYLHPMVGTNSNALTLSYMRLQFGKGASSSDAASGYVDFGTGELNNRFQGTSTEYLYADGNYSTEKFPHALHMPTAPGEKFYMRLYGSTASTAHYTGSVLASIGG